MQSVIKSWLDFDSHESNQFFLGQFWKARKFLSDLQLEWRQGQLGICGQTSPLQGLYATWPFFLWGTIISATYWDLISSSSSKQLRLTSTWSQDQKGCATHIPLTAHKSLAFISKRQAAAMHMQDYTIQNKHIKETNFGASLGVIIAVFRIKGKKPTQTSQLHILHFFLLKKKKPWTKSTLEIQSYFNTKTCYI